MSKYMIVGGGGVFGVHLTKYLLERDDTEKVFCIGRNFPRSPAFALNVGKDDPRYKYEQIHIVFEQDRLFELFDEEKPQVVINFAALAYATSWVRSHRYYETNVVALSKICEHLMSRSYLERFVQIGTSELYGSTDAPANEDAPLKPTSPYAVSKLAADLHLETLWRIHQFPMNIIRPSNAYGPGQLLYRVIPRAVLCGLTEQKFPLRNEGLPRKSYLHALDVARAIFAIIERAPFGVIYNAGPDGPISIRNLVSMVASEMGISFDEFCVSATDDRVGEDAQYWLDSSRITNELGWKPTIDLQIGIRDMVDWGRLNYEELKTENVDFVLRA